MTNHIAGKVIVVTGAASGFGRLVAEKAVARGARVVGGDLDEQGLAETLAAVSDSAAMAVLRTDVTKLEDVQALVALAVERFGAIDVMVNNAGTMPLAFFSDHETAMGAWNRCIDVNFRGVLNGMVAAHDPMLAAGRGQIVNLSSIYGNFPTIGGAVYGATKAAVDVDASLSLTASSPLATSGLLRSISGSGSMPSPSGSLLGSCVPSGSNESARSCDGSSGSLCACAGTQHTVPGCLQ